MRKRKEVASDPLRGTGRTTAILRGMISALADPKVEHVLFVAHNEHYARELQTRCLEIASVAGFADRVAKVVFCGVQTAARAAIGRRAHIFFDHFVYEYGSNLPYGSDYWQSIEDLRRYDVAV